MRRKEISVFLMEGKKEAIKEVAELGIKKVVVAGGVSTPELWQVMAYHKLLGFPVSKIRRWVEEAKRETVRKVVPVVQAFPEPPVSSEEFRESLEQTESEVMVFFFEAMERRKRQVVKELNLKS